MSCCALLPLPAANMLTLSQVSLLVAKVPQDDNNNFGCGSLALKMMSSRCSLAGRTQAAAFASSGPKRCLFGAPSAADTQRLLREDQDAVKTRMLRRWGWDLSREAPSAPSSTWQWEPVKARRHPYAVRVSASSPRAAPATPVPAMVSPLPATPTTSMNSSATSSSSGTSSLSSPTSPCPASPASQRRPSTPTEQSDDSCCGGSESDLSTPCSSPRPHAAPVQTRITDFWRTRRCSTSEAAVKVNPGVPSTGASVSV